MQPTTTIYTSQDWATDNTFKAKAYQEITPEIYNHFLERLPPIYAPVHTVQLIIDLTREFKIENGTIVTGAFQNSEPVRHESVMGEYKAVYHTFYETIDNKYFYMGTLPIIK